MRGAILITGATGFVGRALLDALSGTDQPVIALVRGVKTDLPPFVIQRIAGSIEDLDQDAWLTVLEGVDCVIHLAAIAHIGPDVPEDRYDAVNHRAVAAMAEAARLAGVRRIVFLSSIRAQCGVSTPEILTEATAAAPTDAYGRAKHKAELALARSGVEHVILRPVLIVGPGAKGNLDLLMRLADSALPLPVAGLKAERAMVSLADVVAAILRAADDPAMAGGTFILADEHPLGFGAVVAALRRGLGRPERLFSIPSGLLALPFRLAGRQDLWARIAGPLVVRPEALAHLGWRGVMPARQALESLGRSHRREP
ncbi:MAG: NAD-dependent epimerase/dehydratase family protein [Proteobacteria bacterium]|nr:NAD-dependent epimerase/dehydratase family protein [Pseudomonadota bacterium]